MDEFLAKLFEVADFDPESVSGEKRDSFHSSVKIVREQAYAFNFARAWEQQIFNPNKNSKLI